MQKVEYCQRTTRSPESESYGVPEGVPEGVISSRSVGTVCEKTV